MTCQTQSSGLDLRLRPLRDDDEAAYRNALQVMAAEGHAFGFALEPAAGWNAFLRSLDDRRRGLNVPDDLVPATFLVADVGGTIGYCVLPGYRRRGYATEILRQSLVITRALGVERVLIFCDDDNTGSIGVIEARGGRLDSVFSPGPSRPPLRRYWID